jgi:hypothetical protein
MKNIYEKTIMYFSSIGHHYIAKFKVQIPIEIVWGNSLSLNFI